MESKINCCNNCYINIISKIEVICRRKREIRLIVFKLQLILRDIKSSRIFQRRRKRYPTTFPFFFFFFFFYACPPHNSPEWCGRKKIHQDHRRWAERGFLSDADRCGTSVNYLMSERLTFSGDKFKLLLPSAKGYQPPAKIIK